MQYVQLCKTLSQQRFRLQSAGAQARLHVLVKTLARSVTQSARARYWLPRRHIPLATAPRQLLKKATVSGKSADAQSFYLYTLAGQPPRYSLKSLQYSELTLRCEDRRKSPRPRKTLFLCRSSCGSCCRLCPAESSRGGWGQGSLKVSRLPHCKRITGSCSFEL